MHEHENDVHAHHHDHFDQHIDPAHLLEHMMEHNNAHFEELKSVAETLDGEAKAKVLAAVETMTAGNKQLEEALALLKEA